MTVTRFTTTRLSDLRAAGRLQEMQHATIAPFLERELGPEYGRLFADFEAESSDVRAWYTDAQAPPRPIATLSDGEAEALRQRVADMVGRIADFASRISSESTQKANIARILNAATTFPIEDLWVDGTQPLIVNWGFHRQDVEGGVPRPIRDRIRPAVAPFAAAAAIAESAPAAAVSKSSDRPAKRRWFLLPAALWLAFATLAAVSYDLLLPACGLVGPFGFHRLVACPLSTGAAHVFAEGAELQAQVEAAELDAARRSTCRPPRHAALTPSQGDAFANVRP